MAYPQLYLKFPGSKFIRVSVTSRRVGPAIVLKVWLIGRNISFELIGLANDVLALAAPGQELSEPRAVTSVLSMTPADVVRYFEQSPILSCYADDVRTAVLNASEATTSDFQLKNDLQAIQGRTWQSGADIAEILFGDRSKTGGAYRRRILAVQQAQKTTTTTSKSVPTTGRTAKKAA